MAPCRRTSDSLDYTSSNAVVWESGFGKGVERVGEFWVGWGLCGLDTALDVGIHVVIGGGEEGEGGKSWG